MKNTSEPVTDITSQVHLEYRHSENHFVEFDREGLIPHMYSTEGPAVAVGDMNNDGLEDVYLGSARNKTAELFIQQPGGIFQRSLQPAFIADSSYETTSAVWADVNKDGFTDLIAASGGNEYYGADAHNMPRVYLNNKANELTLKRDAFDSLYMTASSITAYDFTGDGFVDLFIGAKTVPWDYGKNPSSYLMENDGSGHFTNATAKYIDGGTIDGFVTQAQWIDMNGDKHLDLLCSFDWGRPAVFFVFQWKI